MKSMRNYKFSIRKLSLGVCSVIVGVCFLSDKALADSMTNVINENNMISIPPSSDVSKNPTERDSLEENTILRDSSSDDFTQNPQMTDYSVNNNSSEAPFSSKTSVPTVISDDISSDTVAVAEKEENPNLVNLVDDVPTNSENTIKPKEIKFDSWQEVLDWTPDARADDALNRASVRLQERFQGQVINPQANPEVKVQALSNTNSKA